MRPLPALLLAGDFNCPISAIDSQNHVTPQSTHGYSTQTEVDITKKWGLIDTFRTVHPKAVQFTHFGSQSHKLTPHYTARRLDRIYTTTRCNTASIITLPENFSDHALILATPTLPSPIKWGHRRMKFTAPFPPIIVTGVDPLDTLRIATRLLQLPQTDTLIHTHNLKQSTLSHTLKHIIRTTPEIHDTHLLHSTLQDLQSLSPCPLVPPDSTPPLQYLKTNITKILFAISITNTLPPAPISAKQLSLVVRNLDTHCYIQPLLVPPAQAAHEVITHFTQIFKALPPTKLHPLLTTFFAVLSQHIPPLPPFTATAQSVLEVLTNTTDSAPGHDGLPFSAWKGVPHVLADAAVQLASPTPLPHPYLKTLNKGLLTLIPKKGVTKITENRPLTLQNTSLKTISHLLRQHITPLADKICGPQQHGFLPERRAAIAVKEVHSWLENDQGIIMFVDLKQAFDSVDRQTLLDIISILPLHSSISHLCKNLLIPATNYPVLGGRVSPTGFVAGRGVKQGDPASPILFNLYLSPTQFITPEPTFATPPIIYPKIQKFADDIAFYARNVGALRNLYASLSFILSLLHMHINIPKTKLIAWNLGEELPREFSEMQVEAFKYLGVFLSRKTSAPVFAFHEKLPIIHALARSLFARTTLPLQTRIHIFNLYCMSKLSHIILIHTLPTPVLTELQWALRSVVGHVTQTPTRRIYTDIALQHITTPRCFGGLGAFPPDLRATALLISWVALLETPKYDLPLTLATIAPKIITSLTNTDSYQSYMLKHPDTPITTKRYLIHLQSTTTPPPIRSPHTYPNPPTALIWNKVAHLEGTTHEGIFRFLHHKIRCVEWERELPFVCPWCRTPMWGPTHVFVTGCPKSPAPDLKWLTLELFGSAIITALLGWSPTTSPPPSIIQQAGVLCHAMHVSRLKPPAPPPRALLEHASAASMVDAIFPEDHALRERFRNTLPENVKRLLPPLPNKRARVYLDRRSYISISFVRTISNTHTPHSIDLHTQTFDDSWGEHPPQILNTMQSALRAIPCTPPVRRTRPRSPPYLTPPLPPTQPPGSPSFSTVMLLAQLDEIQSKENAPTPQLPPPPIPPSLLAIQVSSSKGKVRPRSPPFLTPPRPPPPPKPPP